MAATAQPPAGLCGSQRPCATTTAAARAMRSSCCGRGRAQSSTAPGERSANDRPREEIPDVGGRRREAARRGDERDRDRQIFDATRRLHLDRRAPEIVVDDLAQNRGLICKADKNLADQILRPNPLLRGERPSRRKGRPTRGEGASAPFLQEPLQRIERRMRVARAHFVRIESGERFAQIVARWRLGLVRLKGKERQRIERATRPRRFEIGEHLARPAQHGRRQSGELGDLDAVGAVGRARRRPRAGTPDCP